MASEARFRALCRLPDAEVPLDEAMLVVSAVARPGVDEAAALAVLDDLADRCPAPTLDALVRHLFGDEGFRGNRAAYYDPDNSYLDVVLARRLGIPISLAVVALSVGRRLGVPLSGVAMPGHFLLRDRVLTDVFVDPFRGVVLDAGGCARVFRELHGPGARFDERYLEPVGPRVILRRVLANLSGIHRAAGDRRALARVLRLRALVPGATPEERRELAGALAASGQFEAAAAELEALAADGSGERAAADRAAAARHRARLN
ncbi:MAG: transglutaminase family protein [Acidimicrobiales bacterium]|nr:transglutaminase family protein [Acidimicrobiales bacterium]MCB9373703.1 hypothetical protein [Microthrixaceae bacterium]